MSDLMNSTVRYLEFISCHRLFLCGFLADDFVGAMVHLKINNKKTKRGSRRLRVPKRKYQSKEKMNFARVLISQSFSSKLKAFPLFLNATTRNLCLTPAYRCKEQENPEDGDAKTEELIDPAIDRTKIIPVETSIRYLKSAAYQTTYGEQPVWVPYRRNFRGQHQPPRTRKTCIRAGRISTGNPCPICRDEYLVLDHNNVDLLKQFISEHTGEVSCNVQ
jgi:ribosomal protein S18